MWRFLKKLEIELTYNPAIPLLGRNVKRNYEALIAIGNTKCWVPVSLGNMKQVFSLSVSLALS